MFDERPTEKMPAKKSRRLTSAQAAQPGIGKTTLWFPRHLAGYDEAELEARALASYAYDWRRR